MKILVTGCAGFIGYHVTKYLLKNKHEVIGIDNINNYYDVKLKKSRMSILNNFKNFNFFKFDLVEEKKLNKIINKFNIKYIVHLAAQAGVRYSIENPKTYFKNNLEVFFNILEVSKKNRIKHLIFASTSSVYGENDQFPLKEIENTDKPISFYAATKKSNEVLAHSYSYIYNLPCTALRFFTVYGPYGRPDMSLFKFAKSIENNKPIFLFNKGNMGRSFTYIDDVVKILLKLTKKIPKKKKLKKLKTNISPAPFRIINIGNPKKYSLKKYLKLIEKKMNKKTKIKLEKMQLGDVKETTSSTKELFNLINNYKFMDLEKGIINFVNWFRKR